METRCAEKSICRYRRAEVRPAVGTRGEDHGRTRQSRSLATGLAQGGVKFMHIGCNSACTFPAYPPLFWWEGPDGSRVLTMYSGSYGTCDALYPHDWLCAKDPSKDGCLGHNLLPPPGWPHKTWGAIIVTADNSGPPKMDEVKAPFTDVAQEIAGREGAYGNHGGIRRRHYRRTPQPARCQERDAGHVDSRVYVRSWRHENRPPRLHASAGGRTA